MATDNPQIAAMRLALEREDKASLNDLIQEGFDLDTVIGNGRTALQTVATSGQFDMARLLIVDHKANVDKTTALGETALSLAVHNGHLEIVQLFVNHGADLRQTDFLGMTLLQTAIWRSHVPVVEFLLSCQPNMSYQDEFLLHWACDGRCRLDMVELLVERIPGAVLNCTDTGGNFPLHCACNDSRRFPLEVFRYLLQCFPDAVHHFNQIGHSPLDRLLQCHHDSILKWLGRDPTRTLLSLKLDAGAEMTHTRKNWDFIVALLWYHSFGSEIENEPPRMQDTKQLSDHEFKDAYKWMVPAACSSIHVDGKLLEQLYRVYDSDVALERCPHTGKTPLLIALQSSLRPQTGIDEAARLDSLLRWNPMACRIRDVNNQIPLVYAVQALLPSSIIDGMVRAWPVSVLERDSNGLLLFELAGVCGCDLSVIYILLRSGALVQRIKEGSVMSYVKK